MLSPENETFFRTTSFVLFISRSGPVLPLEFKETSENLTNKINEYEEKLGKPKLLTLIIKSYDLKVIDKIRKYASGLDCEIK